jgi:hypothetical protein
MTEVAAFRDAERTLVETDDITAWSSLYVRYMPPSGCDARAGLAAAPNAGSPAGNGGRLEAAGGAQVLAVTGRADGREVNRITPWAELRRRVATPASAGGWGRRLAPSLLRCSDDRGSETGECVEPYAGQRRLDGQMCCADGNPAEESCGSFPDAPEDGRVAVPRTADDDEGRVDQRGDRRQDTADSLCQGLADPLCRGLPHWEEIPADLPAAIREIKAALRARIAASGRLVEEVFAVVERRIQVEVDEISAAKNCGETVWPVIDYADIANGTVPCGARKLGFAS